MSAIRKCRLLLATAIFALPWTGGRAYAITTAWTNPGTGNWTNAANWTSVVPTIGIDVLITNGGVAQITGTDENARTVTIGENAGTSGTLKVFSLGGMPGGLDHGGIVVGGAGSGTVTVSGAASIRTGGSTTIGSQPTSTGAATITGGSAYWETLRMTVGSSGTGSFTMTGGARGVCDFFEVGSGATGNGTAIVAGAGSDWVVAGTTTIGGGGTGSLLISDGGKVRWEPDFPPQADALIGALAGSTGAVTVTGVGSAWVLEPTAAIHVGVAGTGSLTVTDHGTVAARQININAVGTLSIGDYSLSGLDAVGAITTTGIANNGVLQFDHNEVITYATSITGSGQIRHIGSGATTISNVSTYTGAFTADAGLLILPGSLIGSNYTANAGGTLRFDGSSSVGKTIRANAGGVVEYDNATVNGGFLRGSGVHAIIGGGTSVFHGVTTFNSTMIVQDGEASFDNSFNGGALTNNAPMTFDGVANAPSGVIAVNSSLEARDFTNNGALTVNDGGAVTNLEGNLVAGGGSRTTIHPGGAISLEAGTTFELNGALLVNNGAIAGPVNVNYGSLAKGGGSYDAVNVFDGGKFSPGNSPGSVTVASASFHAGGSYLFELSDAAGTPGNGRDFLEITGALNVTAGTTANSRFVIEIASLDAGNQPGLAANFSAAQPYAFVLATASAGITGFALDKFKLDLSGFQNSTAGGQFSLAQLGNDLLLKFIPGFLGGDFDEDHDVDAQDLSKWKIGFGTSVGASHVQGDADADGDADGADFLIWQRQLGNPASVVATEEVPEPATLLLLALGTLAMFGRRRGAVS